MTDLTNAAAPLSADEEAQLAALQQRATAAAQAKADAARVAVQQLVAGATFKAALTEMEATLSLAPKNTELGYAVNMMDRLASAFAV